MQNENVLFTLMRYNFQTMHSNQKFSSNITSRILVINIIRVKCYTQNSNFLKVTKNTERYKVYWF